MRDKLSLFSERLKGQPMFKMLERVKHLEEMGKKIIHFEVGDPDFDTPAPIKEVGIEAIKENISHYTVSSGTKELKQALSDFLFRTELGFAPEEDQIVVGPGSSSLIYCILRCLINVHSTESIAIQDPGLPLYNEIASLLGIRVSKLILKEHNGFKINAKILKKLPKKTKLVILNSPHNPTGSLIESMKEAYEITNICDQNKILLLIDSAYSMMVYDGHESYSPCYLDMCRSNTIMVSSFSKSFAMAGWRLGYMVGPQWLTEKVSLMMQTIMVCPNSFVQEAAIEACQRIPVDVIGQRDILHKRRDIIVDGLNSLPGVSCEVPKATFYVFPNIKETGLSSQKFADKMLSAGVALLPGTDFGDQGEGYVRMSFTTSEDNIKQGIKIMRRVLG